MECLPADKILEFNPDTLDAVRKMYGFDKPNEMNETINLLEEWVQKQDHFVVKDFDRDFLERTIIMVAKGSVERAKSRLDKLCTLKTLMPHFFGDFDFENFMSFNTSSYVMLPKLTKDHERVFIVNCSRKNFSSKMFLDGYRFCTMIYEYLRAHDYSNSQTVVVDLMEANVADIVSCSNFNDMRQVATLLTEGYGVRTKGIHMLTSSKLIDSLVMLMKQVLSPKLGGRIHVHSSIESVYEFVPKDVLPMEYGGMERSMDELEAEWINILSSEDFRRYREEMSRACTDESRRQTDKFNEQYMGMPGTFRTLSVD